MSSEIAQEFLERLLREHGAAPAIDWDRFRLMQLIPGTAGADVKTREQLLQRGFVELGRGKFDAEAEARSIRSLRALFTQIIGTHFRLVEHDNPMLAALAVGPSPDAPPNLKRLLLAVADVVAHAQAVTVAGEADPLGERLMTLLFVEGKYVGFLPGRRDHEGGAARA